MCESALREVLLVKAIEEADRTGALLPFGDRERTAREVLRTAGLGTDEISGGRFTPAFERALAARASLIVVLPRLALAAIAWLAGRRLQLAGHLPAQIAAYARIALGAGQKELPIAVSVTPYAFEPPPGTVETLARLLARTHGRGAQPELRAAIAYGDESSIPTAFDADAHRAASRVLLMNLAATPETENHGAAIVAAREHEWRRST